MVGWRGLVGWRGWVGGVDWMVWWGGLGGVGELMGGLSGWVGWCCASILFTVYVYKCASFFVVMEWNVRVIRLR